MADNNAPIINDKFTADINSLVAKLFNLAMGILIKDTDIAQEMEIQNKYVEQSLSIYMNANLYYKDDPEKNQKLIDMYIENTKYYIEHPDDPVDYTVFREFNPYYIDLFKKNVNIFEARSSQDFEFLGYTTMAGFINDEPYIFKELYSSTREYFLSTNYTDAFNDDKVNYKKYCRFYIVFFTIERFLDDNFSNRLISTNYLDQYFILNYLYSYGIYFLNNLLPKYQKNIIHNLDFFFANKGTNSIYDKTLEVFEFDDSVEFDDYYIIDNDGEYDFIVIPTDVDDPEKFIDELSEDDFHDRIVPMDDVINGDPEWQATDDEMRERDIEFEETKYIGFQITRDILKESTSNAFLYSMFEKLKYYGRIEKITFSASIFNNEEVNVFDTMILLMYMVLITIYDTKKDEHDGENVRPVPKDHRYNIYNFNYDYVMDELSNTIKNKYPELIIDNKDFTKTDRSELDLEEIGKNFNANYKKFQNIEDAILKTTEFEEYYELLYKDYPYLFNSENLVEYFDSFDTYKEYIYLRSPNMTNYLNEFLELGVTEDDIQKKMLMINKVNQYLEAIMGQYVELNLMPINFIVEYAYALISYFKSHLKKLVDTEPKLYIYDKLGRIPLFDKLGNIDTEFEFADIEYFTDSITSDKEISIHDDDVEWQDVMKMYAYTEMDYNNTYYAAYIPQVSIEVSMYSKDVKEIEVDYNTVQYSGSPMELNKELITTSKV